MTVAVNRTLAAQLRPGLLLPTWNGRVPAATVAMRAADIPGISALPVRSLFPWMEPPIWSPNAALGPTDTDEVRERARARVRAMDWSRVRERSRVNILANPHALFVAGEAYVVMLEEIERHLVDTFRATTKVCLAEGMAHIENPDFRHIHDLPGRFRRFEEVPQSGPAVAVETRIGRFWMMERLFNADHFVHTHVTEPRETYLHRMIDRMYKPFGMSYARLESRSAYHFGFGPRSGQLLSRLVFESPFIQQRYAGTVALDCSPEGALDVFADRDLQVVDRAITGRVLRNFGTLIRLLAEIDECVCVFDHHYSANYCYGGGLTFANLYYCDVDFFDLDNLALKTKTAPAGARPGLILGDNKAIRNVVINYMAGGLPATPQLVQWPYYIVGDELYRWMVNDPCNPWIGDKAIRVPDLPTALEQAKAQAGTDKVLVFDNTPGAFRVSEPLLELLVARAPEVDREVREQLMPRWLAQRNLPLGDYAP